MDLFYREIGVPDGTPVVVLHGLLGSGANWQSVAREWFASGYRVLLVDLPNHGRSPRSAEISYPAMASELSGFFDRTGVERAILVGHSMGGKVAMQFALDYPDRAGQLVVVDIAPRAYADGHTALLEALRSLDVSAYGAREEVDEALRDRVPAVEERQFLLKNLAMQNGSGFSWLVDLDAIHSAYPNLLAAVEGDGPYMGPALFVRGEASGYVLDGDWLDIVRLFPAAEMETVPGAGHWTHVDAPDVVGEAIRTFLDF